MNKELEKQLTFCALTGNTMKARLLKSSISARRIRDEQKQKVAKEPENA